MCKGCIAVLLLIFSFGVFGEFSVHAASGKSTFKEKCLSCHNSSKASIVAPIDKSSSQWKRFFKRKKHKRKAKIALLSEMNEEQLAEILVYLINHAFDSDQPEVAGAL